MPEELTTENENLNSHNAQVTTASSAFVFVPTIGISLPEATYASLIDGTLLAYGTIIQETTGTPFQIKLVKDCTIKHVYSSKDFTGSLLSFLNIVNNNDGWSFLLTMNN